MIRRSVAVACAAALAIGLFCIFVWAPHPWGREGFDNYHSLGLTLARGEPFPTVDQPWGYAYFLAFFYRLFGNHPVVPLVAQALLNALLPLLVFEFARTEFDERVASVAAVLTGFLCFNTVYASTQASDSVCTVIFMAAVLLVTRARRRGDDWRPYALGGLLLGIAPQFRPNLILVPLLIAAWLVIERPSLPRVRGAVLVTGVAGLALMPWVVHVERLTGQWLPTSTHGGVQLWYGSLQTGENLTSRSRNPRSVFEAATFPSTSLDRVPLVVTGRVAACASGHSPVLVYWTDRDPHAARTAMAMSADGGLQAEMPPLPAPTTYYFYVGGLLPSGHPAPSVYFVSEDHLGDLDRHGDLVDVFDLVRLARHLAWGEPVAEADRLDFDADGRLTDEDVRLAADALLAHATPPVTRSAGARVLRGDDSVTLQFADRSTIVVPRAWRGRVTDLEVSGDLAATLIHTTVPFAKLRQAAACQPVDDLAVNAVYYRAEPEAMRRYLALAYDNIRRDPPAYLASVAYRAVRVFFIEGSADPHTAYQFRGSGRIYTAARGISVLFLAFCAAGIVAAKRRGAAISLPLLLIAYIPATLAFVLTNMRYSISVQPLMFVFVAALLVSVWEGSAAGRRPAGSETARQP